MTDKPTGAPPLEPLEAGGMWNGPIVDFAGYKSRAGKTPWKAKQCEHKSVTYSSSERRVWCDDCESPVDAFDAFMTLTRHFEEIVRAAQRDRREAWAAKNAVIIRRAAKEIDRTWGSGMAPCCPHCRRGLLPHDFADGASSAVSKELEIARRRRDVAVKELSDGRTTNETGADLER